MSTLKRAKTLILAIFLLISSTINTVNSATNIAYAQKGKILLAVEAKGEAWYVNPVNLKRYYLGRPADAFQVMRQLALGINNANFNSFKGIAPVSLRGQIVLKVEDGGKAYYISPVSGKMYFLGRPDDAFRVMRSQGLGISNTNLANIPIAPNQNTGQNTSPVVPPKTPITPVTDSTDGYNLATMEQKIFELVNQERINNGLAAVAWDDKVAAVAREHSQNLADENRILISEDKLCSYAFIHHEGKVFGLYQGDRLKARQVFNQSSSAENIALIPLVKSTTYYSNTNEKPLNCQTKLDALNSTYETKVKATEDATIKLNLLEAEIINRKNLLASSPSIEIAEKFWQTALDADTQATQGWMNSPGHRANILNDTYTHAGMGVARVKDYIIITQVFVKRVECGFQTGPCCEKPGYYPYCYIPLNCQNNTCQ